MRTSFWKTTLLSFSLTMSFLGIRAQVVSPLPQKATYGERAFDNSVKFRFIGADKADADAVAVLRETLTVANDNEAVSLTIGEVGDRAVKQYSKLIPEVGQGYYLKVTPTEVVIAGHDEEGTFYGVQTFLQLMNEPQVRQCEIVDWPSVATRGVIEGFYGNPWSHEDRLRQFDFYGYNKMNFYVYGPKDDPYHRTHWREPYPPEEAQRLSELAEAARRNKVQFVWAVHPGGDIRWNLQDSIAIVSKLEAMYELGVRSFAVFFDDISGEGTRGDKQAGLLNYITDSFVRKHEGVRPLIICPTDYNKSWAGKNYLPKLGKTLYPEVRIMWTGNSVVDMIERDDLEWVNPRIGRKAFIWLNYPVNDYCQSRMLMGKTYGNGLDIADMVSGFCSNPMEYAEASKVSLYSIADYTWNMAAYDAQVSWERAMDYLMPTARIPFRFFCENNIDIGKTGHGLRREGESDEFTQLGSDDERLLFFIKMQAMASMLLADSVNSPEMLKELCPWVNSMRLLGERGALVCQMRADFNAGDTLAFVGHYKAQQAVYQEIKNIVSRDIEGSIVKARPMVSGDVVTPWVNEALNNVLEEYKHIHVYGADLFPEHSIDDGEYLVMANGKYLTNSLDEKRNPVFVAERDMVNPQRQQWTIEMDSSTHRYKITSKHDGCYINERGTFARDMLKNPYEPEWHTFILTRLGGKYSIQCAGNGGSDFLTADGEHLSNSKMEQLIFDIEMVK